MKNGKFSFTSFLLNILFIIWQQNSLIFILFLTWLFMFLFSWMCLNMYDVVERYGSFNSSNTFSLTVALYPFSKFFIGMSPKIPFTSLYVSSYIMWAFMFSYSNFDKYFAYSGVFVHSIHFLGSMLASFSDSGILFVLSAFKRGSE